MDGDIPLAKLVEFRRKRARVEKGAAVGAPGALLGSGTRTGANTEDGQHVRDPAAQAAAGGESATDSALAGVKCRPRRRSPSIVHLGTRVLVLRKRRRLPQRRKAWHWGHPPK